MKFPKPLLLAGVQAAMQSFFTGLFK